MGKKAEEFEAWHQDRKQSTNEHRAGSGDGEKFREQSENLWAWIKQEQGGKKK